MRPIQPVKPSKTTFEINTEREAVAPDAWLLVVVVGFQNSGGKLGLGVVMVEATFSTMVGTNEG